MKNFTCLLCGILLACGVGFAQAGKEKLAKPLSKKVTSVKYKPNWESLDRRPTPKWWTDARFGIFIHWGVYSVPAWAPKGTYSEWYWHAMRGDWKTMNEKQRRRRTAVVEFHKNNYSEDFKYADFAGMFRAELFDPDHWADVFLRSGAKYVVLTSKHHDGFCLWPSERANKTWGQPWNALDIGPRRDLLGELTEAVRRKKLKMGFYYSLYEWFNPLWLKDKKRYVDEHMFPQFKEVVTRYKPSVIFSDGEWSLSDREWKSEELVAWLFNESPCREDVVINDRWGKGIRHKHGGYYTTEYGSGLKDARHPWEENRGMGTSFGYNRNESLEDYKSARELVLMLVDLVSRGGNFLLNIGPTADGRIPVIMEQRLIQMGEWLKVNGEAIYGTRPWRQSRQWSSEEIPQVNYGRHSKVKYDISEITGKPAAGKAVVKAFFTSKGDTLYAITPRWPNKKLVIKKLIATKNTVVTMLGLEEPLEYKAVDGNIVIHVDR